MKVFGITSFSNQKNMQLRKNDYNFVPMLEFDTVSFGQKKKKNKNTDSLPRVASDAKQAPQKKITVEERRKLAREEYEEFLSRKISDVIKYEGRNYDHVLVYSNYSRMTEELQDAINNIKHTFNRHGHKLDEIKSSALNKFKTTDDALEAFYQNGLLNDEDLNGIVEKASRTSESQARAEVIKDEIEKTIKKAGFSTDDTKLLTTDSIVKYIGLDKEYKEFVENNGAENMKISVYGLGDKNYPVRYVQFRAEKISDGMLWGKSAIDIYDIVNGNKIYSENSSNSKGKMLYEEEFCNPFSGKKFFKVIKDIYIGDNGVCSRMNLGAYYNEEGNIQKVVDYNDRNDPNRFPVSYEHMLNKLFQ